MSRLNSSRWIVGGLCAALTLLLILGLADRSADAQIGSEAEALRAGSRSGPAQRYEAAATENAASLLKEGRRAFRFDTFGSEAFWGDTLQLHRAIAGAKLGGVGPGLSPVAALGAGLKVDADALPPRLLRKLGAGRLDLNDPAVTLELLRHDAVVGVRGVFDGRTRALKSVGINCSMCHSTVDDSIAPGIGRRLDGWANRDLNVGAIAALSPDLQAVAGLLGVDEPTVRTVLNSWGPGKFDAALFLDGKAFRPDGKSAATLIPPAFGLAGVNLHTWTGWGSVSHWNAFVANLEMHGVGSFFDPRLDDADRFPIAARNRFGHVTMPPDQDRITAKLPALQLYQLSLPAPKAPAGSYDRQAAARGQQVFLGAARCGSCHVPPIYTEPGWNMHTPEEIGIDSFQAERAPDRRYRTAPLKGLWSHQKGGFYHDGRFPTLGAVVDHYDRTFRLQLTGPQKTDLVEYLKSL
ncbi:MAG: hypothetical protein ACK47B_15620 [Armatimonadota bacterium]